MTRAKWLSLSGFFAVLLLSGVVLSAGLLTSIDNQLLDAGFKLNRHWFPQQTKNDVVVVGIDDAFIESIDEPSALSHTYLGEFLRAVGQAGPKVIGMDMALPEKRFDTLTSTRNPDIDYHKALLLGLLQGTQNTTVVVAKVWDKKQGHYQNINVDYASVLGNQDEKIQAFSSALFCPDKDGTIRNYPGKNCQPDRTNRVFAGEIGAAMGQRQDWQGLINYQIGTAFSYLPLQQVLKWDKEGNTAELTRNFAGKAVILGTVLEDEDRLNVPVQLAKWQPRDDLVFGVLVQAQLVRSMLNQGFIQPAPMLLVGFLCVLFALFWFGDSVAIKLPIFIVMSTGLLALSDMLLLKGSWLPPAGMLFTGAAAFGGSSALQAWRNFRDKQHLMRTFSGSVSPEVMKEIIAGGVGAERKGRKLPVCVLFSDIRGFTTMSEKLPAEEVVSLLNRYFARMTAAVHRHGGTVDKFIGDGMMAFFGAPNLIACPEKSALAAANDMVTALEELNAEFIAEGRSSIAIGIGLHSGEVVIGYIGSPERHEYTAIGDTVNIAARLEGLCKEVGAPIVCSETVYKAVGMPESLVNCGERALKGRSSLVVYGLKTQEQQTEDSAELAV